MENKKLKTQELKTKIERALWFTEMFAFSEKEKHNRFKDLPEVEQKMIKQIVFITLFQRSQNTKSGFVFSTSSLCDLYLTSFFFYMSNFS